MMADSSNISGLARQALNPLLSIVHSSSILLLTETWLLSPLKYPTRWKQFHTYGIKTQPLATKGSQGISLLVNPDCKYHVHHFESDDTHLSQYKLSFAVANILVHCLYLPPHLDNQTITQVLNSLPHTTNHTSQTIICGDFNARLGSLTGDRSTNSRGNLIIQWMQRNNIILWNQRLAYGQFTFMAHQGSSIIDLFMSNAELVEPSMKIYQDYSLDSNHKLLSLSFQISANIPQLSGHPRVIWSLRKLADPNTHESYVYRFKELSQPLLPYDDAQFTNFNSRTSAVDYIEKLNNDICQAIYTSLDDCCGRVSHSGDPLYDFWTDKMQEAYDYREFCYRKWRKAHGLNKFHYWLKHQEARAALRRLINQRRRAKWISFCEQMASGDYTKAISRLSRIRKNRTMKPTFSTPEGPQHAANVMASHLESTFSGDLLREVQYYEIETPVLPSELDCPIIMEDISRAISTLPVKKAPGVDHLRIEMLQPIRHLLAPILLRLFQMCWAWSYVPQTWRIAQVVPIYKKGSPSNPGNYRPISLTTVFRKILERCIQHDLQADGPPLDIAQGGFREFRSALDQALCLSEICNILRTRHQIKPVLAFLDIKSAYDTVNRSFVWETLRHYISSPMLGLLRCLFDDVQIEVLLSNATSYRFSPKTGVLQGSILSPYLYSVYINQLPAQLRLQALNPNMSPLEIVPSLNCLLYADDVVLIAERSKMIDLLKKCEYHSMQMGYKWNPSKCVVLDSHTDPISYIMYGQPLPQKTTFAYLGVPFKQGGYLDPEELIQHNTRKALATMNLLSSIGVNPSGFSKLLSTRFYAHIIRPQLERSARYMYQKDIRRSW
ncbi:hypothetical protein G6F22_006146 [Rhizopus arrhizus]|uniref:Reverse transcriptase domain-containing protein n=1 Tax=Rhizopus oryzae TaxID=64495 RepID=A0A9P6X4Y3_RHIOR|nr:hypothetical protein G6F21_008634 [Rhizopus arrhizus]KAG0791403.1 hypothetical protein G6F22_006146 [Rhizopus arrhizus]KAG1108134.1 hypothetical protein G6F40_009536 [Rhizopus arrhizus]KAG1305420.1 hypothetical protein G6F64_008396 [Rhizopus arrhizus]